MMFIGGAVAGAALSVLATGSDAFLTSGSYDLARAEIHKITTIYATKMAGVFMISTSTIFMPDSGSPALDGDARACPGVGPVAECNQLELAGGGVSVVGTGDQRIRPDSGSTFDDATR